MSNDTENQLQATNSYTSTILSLTPSKTGCTKCDVKKFSLCVCSKNGSEEHESKEKPSTSTEKTKNINSMQQNLNGNTLLSLQTQVKEILHEAKIPALSMCWSKDGEIYSLAGGVTDTSNPIPVDSHTLFQAASLSKPISGAIVLDLVVQNQWDLDTPLAEIEDYGPPEIQADRYYRKLTTRMVIGQCAALPNWFYGEKDKKFLTEPGKQFNYSGIALDFLKELLEKKLQKNWETIAQDFFRKTGMRNSTFKPLSMSHLHDKRHVAREHQADVAPYPVIAPTNSLEIPAGSLLTTATDYINFLQYCFNDTFLKATLLTGFTPLNPSNFPEITNQIQWGLGMGIFTDQEKKLAFHWGNNTGSHAFCAMNIDTGDSVACFVNSENGPNVFQKLSEAVVGDMSLLFQWLSSYCAFKAVNQIKTSFSVAELFQVVSLQRKNDMASSHAIRSIISENFGFFRKLEDQYLTEHRHDDSRLQHEYDKRFGLVLKIS